MYSMNAEIAWQRPGFTVVSVKQSLIIPKWRTE